MTYFQIAWHYMTKNEKKKSVSDPKSTHVAFCPMGVKLRPSAIRMKNCRRLAARPVRAQLSRVGSGSSFLARVLLSHPPRGQGLHLSMLLLLIPCPHLTGFPQN